jgi:mono/diheme cytochrome c family protein
MTSHDSPFALSLAILFAAASSGAGCLPAPGTDSSGSAGSAKASGPDAHISAEQAKKEFEARCGACHGPAGAGDGPGAVALNPKPRNFGDKEWQTSVTDEQIRKTMTYGGAAVGKNAAMPAAPDLDSKPKLADALVKVVRGFGK